MLRSKHTHLGLDIGGTKISGMLLNAEGSNLLFREVPVRRSWSSRQLRRMLESFVQDLAERAHSSSKSIRTIGIGVPGPLGEDGSILQAVNLPSLTKTRLQKLAPNAKTTIWNDTVCAAYAEATLGSLANCSTGILLMSGTGLGGASVIRLNEQGRLGSDTMLQISNLEIGHVVGDLDRMSDTTNRAFEYEAFCSRQFFRQHTKKSERTLYEAVWKGNTEAAHLFERFGINLGSAIASADTLFRPDTIVLGGGMTAYLPAYRKTMERTFRQRRFHLTKAPQIIHSKFGPEVGALGAALYGTVQSCQR
ncbi:ROK family protein [Candidatus Uhrbacteria bacterium]|nr:ROK family protein [Candidatus Uhrbacteria bacterium]